MRDYKDLNDYEIMYMISENNDDATNLLFSKYMPIIMRNASSYYLLGKKVGLELDDFIQEGYYALACAIKNYTEDMNCLFYTYANICIKSKMQNLIKRNSREKDKALNESISLYNNVANTSTVLLDYIKDNKAVVPDKEIENKELEILIKKMIYDYSFRKSLVCELKVNGFTNKDICTLLDEKHTFIYNTLNDFRKNLLVAIEKINY